MKPFERRYRKIVRASAFYDWIVTAPFAFPLLVSGQLAMMTRLHRSLGLAGEIPAFAPLHLFFINLMGSLVLVWATLRLARPDPLFGLYDGAARALFSAWMIYYLTVWGVTGLLWFFLVPEALWGIVQLAGYRRYTRERDA